jgi:hypothetical protein
VLKGGRCYAHADDRLVDAQVVIGALPSHPEMWGSTVYGCVTWWTSICLPAGVYRVVYKSRARGGAVVEALRYKPEGRGIDSGWCQNFSLT